MSEIGERLKIIRKKLSLNQKNLTKELGLSQGLYSNYESGRVKLSGKLIALLSIKFNINPDWLLTGEGEMFKADTDESTARSEQRSPVKQMIINAVDSLLVSDEEASEILKYIEEKRELAQLRKKEADAGTTEETA
jgi:transcriptional regulator with XRE-family HTH domain